MIIIDGGVEMNIINTILTIMIVLALSGLLTVLTYKAVKDIIKIKNRNNFKF